METEEKSKYENVDERQSEAYERLLDSYFDKIKERCTKGDNKTRIYFIGRLEEIVTIEIPITERTYLFNGNKAREIRLKKGLSLRGLANMVKMPLQSLVSYEKGFYVPRSTRGKGGRRYLEWLKEQGYEPFNLE